MRKQRCRTHDAGPMKPIHQHPVQFFSAVQCCSIACSSVCNVQAATGNATLGSKYNSKRSKHTVAWGPHAGDSPTLLELACGMLTWRWHAGAFAHEPFLSA